MPSAKGGLVRAERSTVFTSDLAGSDRYFGVLQPMKTKAALAAGSSML
jgi:hypothetical protein